MEIQGVVYFFGHAGPRMASTKPPATKPFLGKLYSMLEDDTASSIISWTPVGDAIVVHQPEAFAQQLLPLYFKHNNFSSFVRQLNTYGFNKTDPDAWVFGHPEFKRGAKEQIHLIQLGKQPFFKGPHLRLNEGDLDPASVRKRLAVYET